MKVLLYAVILVGMCWLSYTAGQADIRMHTVVRFAAPYYQGVFHGECLSIANGMACATDSR